MALATGPPYTIITIAASCGGPLIAVAALPSQILDSKITSLLNQCVLGLTLGTTSVQGDPTQAVIDAIGSNNPGYLLEYDFSDSACTNPSKLRIMTALVGAPGSCIGFPQVNLVQQTSSVASGSFKYDFGPDGKIIFYRFQDTNCNTPSTDARLAQQSIPENVCSSGTSISGNINSLQSPSAQNDYLIIRTGNAGGTGTGNTGSTGTGNAGGSGPTGNGSGPGQSSGSPNIPAPPANNTGNCIQLDSCAQSLVKSYSGGFNLTLTNQQKCDALNSFADCLAKYHCNDPQSYKNINALFQLANAAKCDPIKSDATALVRSFVFIIISLLLFFSL